MKVAKSFSYINGAIQRNDIDLIKSLIVRSVNFSPASEDICLQVPIVLACELGRLEIVELLIENRHRINLIIDQFLAEDFWDEALTGLMTASGHGHALIVKTLIQAGADPNIKTCYGETALSFAARSGHIEIFEDLAPLTTCIDQEQIYLIRKIASANSSFLS